MLSGERSLQILIVLQHLVWVVVVQPGRLWVWSCDLLISLFVLLAAHTSEPLSWVWALPSCSLLGLFVQDYATTDWSGKLNNYLIEELCHWVTTVTTICLLSKSWVNTKSPRLCVICNSTSLMSLTTPWCARSVCLRLRAIWSKSCPRSTISTVVTSNLPLGAYEC